MPDAQNTGTAAKLLNDPVRSMNVLENLVGEAGSAIVDNRPALALKDARIAGVAAARRSARVRTRRGSWRHIVARAGIVVVAGGGLLRT